MNIQNIMLVLDSKLENQTIVDKAIFLAKKLDAQIEISLFEYSNPLSSSHLFDKSGLEAAQKGYLMTQRRWAENYAHRIQSCGVGVSIHVEWAKYAHSAIVERAKLKGVDLIMKATHKHSFIDRTLMSHTDWSLMRETPVPLFLVKNAEWDAHINLAAAVDPMHEEEAHTRLDQRILSVAYELSCQLPAEFHVVHAFEPLATGVVVEFDSLIENYEDYRQAVKSKHKASLDQLLKFNTEPGCKVHFEEGAPEIVLPQVCAQESIDLMVLGAVARSGLDRVIIGSTAERLLDNLDCDLLILRSGNAVN